MQNTGQVRVGRYVNVDTSFSLIWLKYADALIIWYTALYGDFKAFT